MGESRWIILIDKTPRGPLMESEVRILIEQKIVRVNDLASKLDSSPGAKKAEWKFLWQYPEFDRRAGKTEANGKPPEERRESLNEKKIEEKKNELLPEELASIHPEDLSYHSTQLHESKEKDLDSTHIELSALPSQTSTFNWKPLAALPILAALGVFAFRFSTNTSNGKEKPIPAIVQKRPETIKPSFGVKGDPEYERDISSSSPLSNAKPRTPESKKEPEPPPVAHIPETQGKPDRGEISYDEYKRRQEEEFDPEKAEQEELDRMEAEAEEEQAIRSKMKKKAAKRRKAASEEDEAPPKDPLEETIDEDAPRD